VLFHLAVQEQYADIPKIRRVKTFSELVVRGLQCRPSRVAKARLGRFRLLGASYLDRPYANSAK
jgi:hypothetical protein